ncbi:cytochrome P450 monooxygenase [Gaeumannomyces tritici R3-111a-1]|uniref:Cytochrome P450 monooxygenase n=1 Tax=Gaeumannomyces tritici (strain R3-111a-1) TaxID=644352 RepID=J3PEB8_GAET3|nr:cytochrome P450 monooxygenase [Gaeumannomyces tritici R3-111a-1]EJT70818.1 cytochrome P450 monooxygenase [Gaeumannomyces tritici R3-111a-1]
MGLLHLLESAAMPTIGQAVYATVSISLLLFAIHVLRMRVFHPLRRYPGPWLNSVSEIPAAWALLRGRQPKVYKQLHDKYGPIVRVAPNELSFIDVEAWDDIYGFHKSTPNFEKSPIFIGAVSPVDGQTGVSLANNTEHTRQRRALAAPFTNRALLQQEGILQLHVDKLMAALTARARRGEAVNLAEWLTYTTFDIIGDVCFAEPFGCLDAGRSNEWARAIIGVFKAATWDQAIRRVAGTGTPLHRLLVRLVVPAEAAKWRRAHFDNSREKTLRRLAAAADKDEKARHPDLIKHILDSADPRAALSPTEIVLNMVLFISAGSETTANTMTGWAYLMLRDPAALARAAAEVRAAFSSPGDICWESVHARVPYLDASLDEALRLFSPAPSNAQRVVPAGGAVVAGERLPAGTTVAVAPWAAVHTARHFADPDRFAPERWLDGEGADPAFKEDRRAASRPFGTGPRGCMGKNLAYLELRLILARLLWHFDLTPAEGPAARECMRRWDEGDMDAYQTWMKPDLWVDLKEAQR